MLGVCKGLFDNLTLDLSYWFPSVVGFRSQKLWLRLGKMQVSTLINRLVLSKLFLDPLISSQKPDLSNLHVFLQNITTKMNILSWKGDYTYELKTLRVFLLSLDSSNQGSA